MKKFFLILLLLVSEFSHSENIFTHEFEQSIAIRANEFQLVDPHVTTLLFGVLCSDITSTLNDQIAPQLTEDGNDDGYIDLNIITQFNTDQPAYITSRSLNLSAIDGRCPAPLFAEACEINTPTDNSIATIFSEESDCLAPTENTTSGYMPAPNTSNSPCYATIPATSSFSFSGVELNFQEFQQGARYTGGLELDNGLAKGFISEETAQNILFPNETPFIGGQSLASLLPGGFGNCSDSDDRDLFTDGETMGWWFYFNTKSDFIELEQVSETN
jgi:hypothetical protein